ncbi:MAG TPA: hypothetical protein VFA23_10830 [Dongiaceae bacterium]|nr:hypothetical protein [Dongiaceae bacterium]
MLAVSLGDRRADARVLLALAGGLLLLGMVACAERPGGGTSIASREIRSQAYCTIRAQTAGYADYDVAAACRRAEHVAQVRSQNTHIDPVLDRACEDEATLGRAGGPFSWRAYMRCVDSSI